MPIRVRDKRTGRIHTFADGTSPDVIRASVNALRNQERTEALAEAESETRQGVPFVQRAIPMALRVGAPIATGIAGGFATGGLGALPAMAAGSGAGEFLAQAYERETGQRTDLNPAQIGVQTGLGMIPILKWGKHLKPLGRLALRAGHGGTVGATATGLTELAETGELPGLGTLGVGAAFGATMGAGGGALEARALRRATERSLSAERPLRKTVAEQTPWQKDTPLRLAERKYREVRLGRRDAPFGGTPRPGDPKFPIMEKVASKGYRGQEKEVKAALNVIAEDVETIHVNRSAQQDLELAKTRNLTDLADIRPGSALNSIELAHLAGVINRVWSAKHALGEKAAVLFEQGKQMSPEDLNRLHRLDDAFAFLVPAYEGAVSEAGRALRAVQHQYNPKFMELAAKVASENPEALSNFTQRFQERAKVAIRARKFSNNPAAYFKAEREKLLPTMSDKVRSLFYANVLSSEKTQLVNVIGTATSVASRIPSRITGSALDWAYTAAGRQPERTMYLSEVPKTVVATFSGMKEGVRQMAYAWKHGVTEQRASLALERGLQGRFDKMYYEMPGGLLNPLNYAARGLLAADAFFREMAYKQELVGSAWSRAVREVGTKNKAAFDKRFQALLDNRDIKKAAQEFGVETVFQKELGRAGKSLQSFIGNVPGAFLALPFIRIAGNLLKRGVQMSPAGFATKAARGVKVTPRQQIQAQGEALFGTMALLPLVPMALEGRISGRGPRDRTERARLYDLGWKPYSIRVDNTWYDYRLLQPVGVPLAIMANAFEAYRESGQGDEESATDVVLDIVKRAGGSVLEQSYLGGLSDFLTAVEQGGRRWEGWLGRTAGAFVPASGQLRSWTQATDPIIRKPEGWAESAMVGVPVGLRRRVGEQIGLPGIGRELQPRVSRFGEPVRRVGGEGLRGALQRKSWPISISPEVRDPMDAEISRLGVRIGEPSPRLTLRGDMKLTRDEETRLMQTKGRRLRETLERFMTSDRYQRLSDEQRRTVIERLKDRTNTRSNDQFRRSILRERRGR